MGAGLVLALLSPGLLWLRLQLDGSAFVGARLGGEALPERAALTTEVPARARAWGAAQVVIHAGPYVARRQRAQLGAGVDAEGALAWASALGRSGNPLGDLSAYWSASQGVLDRPWPLRIDPARLGAALAGIRKQVERFPVPGTYGRDGGVIAGIPGLTINNVSAASLLERALRRGELEVALQITTVPAPGPARYDVPGRDLYGHVLYAYETKYNAGPAGEGRAQNIEIAARALDGLELVPGDTLSFNETVGERSFERGFRGAAELANRRVIDGIGGGVCQVAATLHAAAFLAGLDIPVYQPHSRPVGYITLGLDTMVSWPDRDLRIRNPYPFPVRVQAHADRGLLRVVLLGADRPHAVEWGTQIVTRIPAGEVEERDPALQASERKVVQDAIDGLVVERRRVVYLPTGPESVTSTLRYPPNPKIVAVGS
ncbi:MAG TPA: VanW family protein [Polyangiales bacterium]|nr:VanW family protein [Polyangiales bacterium]